MMKKKVIRLTESDVERLVRKIIKEEVDTSTPCESTEFDWTCEVPSFDSELPEIFTMEEIDNFQDMLECCSKTRWDVAYLGGEGMFQKYYNMYGAFNVYFDENGTPIMACTGKDKDECFKSDDYTTTKYEN